MNTCKDYELHTPCLTLKNHCQLKFTISVSDTKMALDNINVSKSTGSDNISPRALKEYSYLLVARVTAIFNSSLKKGVLPPLWKSATVIPLSKKHPPVTIENEIRTISLTPIAAKVFKSLMLKWVDVYVKPQIDDKQYGEMAGTCTNGCSCYNAQEMV